MKIAMIGHKRIPSREGGVEIVVEELAKRMVKKGHDVTVYNRKGKHIADKEGIYNKFSGNDFCGIHIVNIPTFEQKSLNAIVYSLFATIMAIFSKYDVIHFHAEGPSAMLPLAKLFSKAKCIVTIHGLDWQRAKWGGFATKFLLFGEKMAAKYADEVIVLSKNVQIYFQDHYQRDCRYIPNGVMIPQKKQPDIIQRKYGLKGADYILFLARIVPEKGLHYLIQAYKQIATTYKLVIAGSSSHTDEYANEIKQMILSNENIIMTGFVEGDELKELYSNCYLYVLPSDVEGMPLSLLEALSYGKTCVVSNIPENREVCRENACYFEKSNIKDLTEKLALQLSDKRMEYSTENLVQDVKKRFDWDNITTEILKLYST